MDPIDHFFADYPSFDYNRSASSPQEFYRMCDHFHWVKDRRGDYPQERIDAHEAFRLAMVEAFNHNFGTNVDDKTSWESICYLLRIEPLPEDVAEMKKLVKSTHVNLSDLLDSGRSGAKV
ncbi:uncharacterized protein A1O5_13271 [Cladophialophora psammophila CBS 110553]|uniref:Uncharacterized protein n=1 Tax=Cladophialophora psammophila CBS 110553 TaxID=1182543 RepID=W9VKE5_9EURO|nr:uncharacterized protein A1O5_13271 [Cladophialophora psammophila CBS 110553]EXJ53495.1 hypothetical protein A1O5_13271 [Cladophialophora psammophila CBS 110553]